MRVVAAVVALLIAGCAAGGRDVSATPQRAEAPTEPGSPIPTAIGLQVFEVRVPRGLVSDDPDVWFPLDEQALPIAVYDVLWANGFRVGVGGETELVEIRGTLATEQATRALVVPPLNANRHTYFVDLPTEPNAEQTLFWFDEQKRPSGRTFIDFQNRIAIEFASTDSDAVRLSVTPVVRSTVGRTRVTSAGEDYVVEEVRDAAAFDLNIRLTLRLGEFALLAPSPDAARATSLGRAFLTNAPNVPPTETVLLIVPQRVSLRPVALPR